MRKPKGLATGGSALWAAVVDKLELDTHEAQLLEQAARTVDLLADLQAVVDVDGPMLDGKIHPCVVELRQQRITLTRIIASLRLPEDLSNPTARPQRRGASRGAYEPQPLRAVR